MCEIRPGQMISWLKTAGAFIREERRLSLTRRARAPTINAIGNSIDLKSLQHHDFTDLSRCKLRLRQHHCPRQSLKGWHSRVKCNRSCLPLVSSAVSSHPESSYCRECCMYLARGPFVRSNSASARNPNGRLSVGTSGRVPRKACISPECVCSRSMAQASQRSRPHPSVEDVSSDPAQRYIARAGQIEHQ